MQKIKNTNEEYHRGEGVSKSDLDLLHSCPQKYRYTKDHPEEREETPALLFGSMVHKYVLEFDDFDSEYATAPEVDRRTKEGKALWSEFAEKLHGRKAISLEDKAKLEEIRKAVMSDPKIAKLLSGEGETETSYYWTDEKTGLLCKCRPDRVNTELNYLIDLKTTTDASPEAFAKSVYNYRYHVQAAWYMRGYEQATGIKPDGFVFIAVEKTAPYLIAVYLINDIDIELGMEEAEKDLQILKNCTESGNWYGYGGEENKIMTLALPSWARPKGE